LIAALKDRLLPRAGCREAALDSPDSAKLPAPSYLRMQRGEGGVNSMVLTTGAGFRSLVVRMAMGLLLKIVARLLVTTTTLALPAAGVFLLPHLEEVVGCSPAAT
jgi:hypothetical protein